MSFQKLQAYKHGYVRATISEWNYMYVRSGVGILTIMIPKLGQIGPPNLKLRDDILNSDSIGDWLRYALAWALPNKLNSAPDPHRPRKTSLNCIVSTPMCRFLVENYTRVQVFFPVSYSCNLFYPSQRSQCFLKRVIRPANWFDKTCVVRTGVVKCCPWLPMVGGASVYCTSDWKSGGPLSVSCLVSF